MAVARHSQVRPERLPRLSRSDAIAAPVEVADAGSVVGDSLWRQPDGIYPVGVYLPSHHPVGKRPLAEHLVYMLPPLLFGLELRRRIGSCRFSHRLLMCYEFFARHKAKFRS